jgi:hypothetical protein
MRPPSLRLLAVLALGGTLAGCGKGAQAPGTGAGGVAPGATSSAVVSVATKNTTRLGGRDPASLAAAVALAVYPGLTPATRPQAVVLVNEHNWPASLVASALASAPLGAPLLYADGDSLPADSARALQAMRPVGAPSLEGAQVIPIATAAPLPSGYRARSIPVGPPGPEGTAELAGAVQRLLATAAHGAPPGVIALATNAPQALQMPAAALAAESGAPILTVTTTGVPATTAATLESLQRPAIYVVGAGALSSSTLAQLGHLGRVKSVAGTAGGGSLRSSESLDPVKNAISVSRFADGAFGWGIHEAGHGLVFANKADPLYAPAGAPLSSHGDYGPLLLLENSASLPPPLVEYLSDIEPGYTNTIRPVREVYNHGWLLGDERSISAVAQAEVDALLEIAPRTSAQEPSVSPPE